MKKTTNIVLLVGICLLLLNMGCKRELLNKPTLTNSNAPGAVTNVTSVSSNGKATLTYSLPSDHDLSYVKAVYEIAPGIEKVNIASRYTNTLTLDGFADTLAHKVKLYAVNSSEIASAATEVTVNPLVPSFVIARRSLKITATFGGFNLTCNNPAADNLAIVTMVDTAGNGEYVKTASLDNIYRNTKVITGSIRGQQAKKRKFGFVVRDRWLNHSDTLFVTLTPLFEQLLPKNKWSNLVLPGDAEMLLPGQTDVRNIYNGVLTENWPNLMFTVEVASTPQMITLDLGEAHVFSRMSINPHNEMNNFYVRGNPRDFEIWGSNSPNTSGALDASWSKLGTFSVAKPSGSPYGTETGADQSLARSGWQFDFQPGLGSYRYIRLRNLRNWQGSYFMSIDEFTLWGQ
ncbi:DUF5000 domain-containing lipoprotein [Pedobacter suwonensis]|uniref:DUF5000 domain-containing lipoprotein n=1 Tax=Pedobacter suwonensis TaxID=332999 RepID=UPI00368786BF